VHSDAETLVDVVLIEVGESVAGVSLSTTFDNVDVVVTVYSDPPVLKVLGMLMASDVP